MISSQLNSIHGQKDSIQGWGPYCVDLQCTPPLPTRIQTHDPRRIHSIWMDGSCDGLILPCVPWNIVEILRHICTEHNGMAASVFCQVLSQVLAFKFVYILHNNFWIKLGLFKIRKRPINLMVLSRFHLVLLLLPNHPLTYIHIMMRDVIHFHTN